MPRSTRKALVWVIAAVALLATSLLGCGGSSQEVVATVAGRPITKATFAHWLALGSSAGGSEGASARRRVMESLISAEWTLAQGAELHVAVGEAEAEQRLSVLDYASQAKLTGGNRLLPEEAALRRSLSAKGLTHADRVWLVRLDLLRAKIEQKTRLLAEQGIAHTRIAKYYEEHRGEFVVGEERDFMILLNRSKPVVLEAKREIEAGKSFLSLEKRLSIYHQAPGGVERLKRGEEEPEFEAHIFAAKLHVLEGPVQQSVYHYIFELTRIVPARRQSLTQAEPLIRRRLAVAEGARTPAETVEARTRSWRGRTHCRTGYVVPLCG